MLTFMQAIARQEGFYSPGTLPNRRNNPGDIEDGPFAQAHGAMPSDGHRFAAWPTPEAGFDAMRALLKNHYLGMTFHAALNKWAPPVENDTSAYEANVYKWTGMKPTDVLTVDNIG